MGIQCELTLWIEHRTALIYHPGGNIPGHVHSTSVLGYCHALLNSLHLFGQLLMFLLFGTCGKVLTCQRPSIYACPQQTRMYINVRLLA